ncbi:methyltransferase domain-containing protein [Pseudonocardia sp. GCM10023141]|uniref:methyltransferase domain-containing protein n=1 Tax=Pseudonocardia sp. GCM10023141 TaxID=3252653 RepID=UPI003619FA93
MLPRCPACDAPAPAPFYAVTGLPVHGTAVLPDVDSARAVAVGDQSLALCATCGVVFNRDFTDGLVDHSGRADEPQNHSPRFAAYCAEIAARWMDRYGLIDQHVVEIGCGSGDFAAELLSTGAGSMTGVDPQFTPDRVPRELADRLTSVPELFNAAHIDRGTAAVVCRHTLEHVPGLAAFGAEIVAGMRRGEASMLLAEVPDLGRILGEGAFWDLQFERCSYFTPTTLAAFLSGLGFDDPVVHTTYSDQYVVAEARLGSRPVATSPLPAAELDRLAAACRAFADRVTEQTRRWRAWLAEHADAGRSVAVWGGGAKGQTFLNVVVGEAERPAVRAVVDLNPAVGGHFTAGLGLPICGPDDLKENPPHSVLLMNPVYLGEVRGMLDARGLGATELLAV